MTSSTEEPCAGHVTSGGVAKIDVGEEAESLLLGRIDDVTSLREPVSKNIKVFVCSTGTGFSVIYLSFLLLKFLHLFYPTL